MEGISSMNLIIGVAGLTICVLGFVQTITSRSMEARTRRYFIAFFSLLVAYVGSNLLGQFGDGALFQTLALFFESAFSSLLTLLLTRFLLDQSGERDWRHNRLFLAAAGLEFIYLALLIYTQFSTTIYCFDAAGLYHRGPYYPLLLIPPVCIMVINLLLLWNRRNLFSKRERIAFAVYILVPMACMVFQMFFFGLYVIVLGTAISAIFMFVNIQNDQTEKYIEKERENAQLRTDIMLSQIQPHFLYNSLTVIRELCHNDPAQAEIATVKFSRYLQGNMESLKAEGTVAFEQELKHTEGYLELAKLRFEDKLAVRYDIQCTIFQIPTLTLQPIVENAVSHGVRGNPDGAGSVTVATREYPDRYEITVTDNGSGFDPETPLTDDHRTHIGIQNVRERLARLCGGSLIIASAPGEGTTATIVLPKEENIK